MSSPSSTPNLAARLARRAIDLFVIGFVVVVGLSVGGQLVDWWRTDPESVAPNLSGLAEADLDWSRTPIAMQFGDATVSIERAPFEGDYPRLEKELLKTARRIVESSSAPTSPPTAAEREWLEALKTAPPELWDSTLGNVFRQQDPLPSFVATRFTEPNRSDEEGLTQRIVGWGLAFPSGPATWTIFSFRPESARVADAVAVRDVSLPENARWLTQLRGGDGCQWLVFQGRGDIAVWVKHFEGLFGAKSIVAKSVATQRVSMKFRADSTVTDLQIKQERNGTLTGVIWSTTTGRHVEPK